MKKNFILSILVVLVSCGPDTKDEVILPPPPEPPLVVDVTDTINVCIAMSQNEADIPDVQFSSVVGDWNIRATDSMNRPIEIFMYNARAFGQIDSGTFRINYPDTLTAIVGYSGKVWSQDPEAPVATVDRETTYTFTEDRRLIRREDLSDPDNPFREEYIYNADGRIIEIRAEGGSIMMDFAYDDNGNVTRIGHDKFEYGAEESKGQYMPFQYDPVADIAGWLDLDAKNVLIRYTQTLGQDPTTGQDYVIGRHRLYDHEYDSEGRVTKYMLAQLGENEDSTFFEFNPRAIDVTYECKDVIIPEQD